MVLEEIFGVVSEQLAQWNRLNDMITHISELLDRSIITEPIEIPPTPIVTPTPTPENNWWDNLIDLFSGGVPYYATGIDYVPNTGLAMLHEGERVTPAGYDYPEIGNQITFKITVNESKNAKATGLAVRNEIEGIIRSDWGRRLIQNTAGGR
jgi:hypothetical protein